MLNTEKVVPKIKTGNQTHQSVDKYSKKDVTTNIKNCNKFNLPKKG
jgi:hypothetical protein